VKEFRIKEDVIDDDVICEEIFVEQYESEGAVFIGQTDEDENGPVLQMHMLTVAQARKLRDALNEIVGTA
jgi:hypothetical protein